MWDTAKDYRILIAMHARELFLRTIQTGSFRGNWNKKGTIEETKKISALLLSQLNKLLLSQLNKLFLSVLSPCSSAVSLIRNFVPALIVPTSVTSAFFTGGKDPGKISF